MRYYMSQQHFNQIQLQCARIEYIFDEPECFLDIGPGKIFSEAWLLSKAWPNCDILGFEPSQKRYEDLRYEYPGILFNCAVSNYCGTLKGYIGNGHINDNGIIDDDFVAELKDRNQDGIYYTEKKIPTISLDIVNEMLGPYKTIFIWADAEDSELSILTGATDILKNNVVGLSLEITNKSKNDINTIFQFLRQFNFRPFIGENGSDLIFRKEISSERSIII